MMTNQKQVRAAFWEAFPEFRRGVKKVGVHNGRTLYVEKTQNDYPTDVRVAFVDFVDHLHRDGQISDALANRATL